MFPDRWLGWDDYLGVRRPYDEGRRVARTLGIASELRWYTRALDDRPVVRHLRLPFRPISLRGDGAAGGLARDECVPRIDKRASGRPTFLASHAVASLRRARRRAQSGAPLSRPRRASF